MTIEKFSNFGFTTLSAGIDNSTTSVAVTSASNFPAAGNFRIVVDSEIMLVTAVTSNTFTVTRGYESTSAVSHTILAQVAQVLTSGSVQQFRQDSISNGAAGSVITPYAAGRIYIPNNNELLYYDDGSNIKRFYNSTMPLPDWSESNISGSFSGYSWDNQSSATIDKTHGNVTFTIPGMGDVNDAVMYYNTAPSTPYSFTALFKYVGHMRPFCAFGLAFRESSSGKIVGHGVECNTSNLWLFQGRKWTTSTNTTTADYTIGGGPATNPMFFRIQDNGTNRIFSYSGDGVNYTTIHSIGRTDFLTADQVGLYFKSQTPSGQLQHDNITTVYSYLQA